jgi:hypothetical protein
MPKTKPDTDPDILQAISVSLKEIALHLSSMAQSVREQADQAKAANRKKGGQPIVTRISQAHYEQADQARQETGSEVPGFRRG